MRHPTARTDGALLSAAVTYAIGRQLGHDALRKFAGKRLNRLSQRLGRRGLLAMVIVRLLPIAPYSMGNVVAGASHIRWREYRPQRSQSRAFPRGQASPTIRRLAREERPREVQADGATSP